MKEPTEKDVPQDIGATLRKRRTLRGESLDSIHQHTRIPKRFLEALEENRFQDLPAPVYLRGFLKSYCDHLDVDFEPVWKKLSQPPAGTAPAAEVPAAGTELQYEKKLFSDHPEMIFSDESFQRSAVSFQENLWKKCSC